MRLVLLLLTLAAPVQAASLCGVNDRAEVLGRIAGEWSGTSRVSLENEVMSELRRGAAETVRLTRYADYTSPLTDDVTRAPVRMALAAVHDVDGVDDLLDTTESADLADRLSDTPCGPEALPQLSAAIAGGDDIRVDGTVTLIPYFDDRMLRLTELTLAGEGAVIFYTETTLLTRD